MGAGGGVFETGSVGGLALGVVGGAAAMCVSVRATGRGVGVVRWQAVSTRVLTRAASRTKMGRVYRITRRTGYLPSSLGS